MWSTAATFRAARGRRRGAHLRKLVRALLAKVIVAADDAHTRLAELDRLYAELDRLDRLDRRRAHADRSSMLIHAGTVLINVSCSASPCTGSSSSRRRRWIARMLLHAAKAAANRVADVAQVHVAVKLVRIGHVGRNERLGGRREHEERHAIDLPHNVVWHAEPLGAPVRRHLARHKAVKAQRLGHVEHGAAAQQHKPLLAVVLLPRRALVGAVLAHKLLRLGLAHLERADVVLQRHGAQKHLAVRVVVVKELGLEQPDARVLAQRRPQRRLVARLDLVLGHRLAALRVAPAAVGVDAKL